MRRLPGDELLVEGCDNARVIARACDYMKIGGTVRIGSIAGSGGQQLGVLDVSFEDPDTRPYLWDLDPEEQE